MFYKRVGNGTKKLLLKNVEVSIEESIDQLKRLRKADGITLDQFIRMKSASETNLKGQLFLVYMSSNLKVEDKEYQELNEKIFDIMSEVLFYEG